MHLYIEPKAGPQPIVQIINQARRLVDLNVYILSDRTVIDALQRAKRRGVKVRVILDRAPNRMGMWQIMSEYRRVRDTGVVVHGAPERFAYDHAKYVCNGFECAVGTADYTRQGLNRNREYIMRFSAPAKVKAARDLFNADWNDKPAGSGPRKQLMIAPGTAWDVARLIEQPGAVDIEQRRIGTDRFILHAMERKGRALRLILPDDVRRQKGWPLRDLKRAGVQVRYLGHPYLHAKLVVGTQYGYIGSLNISEHTIYRNREVGITFGGKPLARAERQFRQDWSRAKR